MVKVAEPEVAAIGAEVVKVAEPVRVQSWTELSADKYAVSEPCEVYVNKLVESVRHRLVIALSSSNPAVGGINLEGTLEQQDDPLQIDTSRTGLTSFKEHWRWNSCALSLGKNWLDAKVPIWDGQELTASELTYGQLTAGRQMLSDEKFTRSSEDPGRRH